MRHFRLLSVALLVGALGCEASTSPPVSSAPPPSPPPPPTAPPVVPPPAAPPQVTVTSVAADEMLGVNAPNQKGANQEWTYSRVLFTNYFGVKEDIAMGQVKQALQIFEATNGRKPKTKEEGMEAIKDVPLPELPDDTYWYDFDPDKQELMVMHKELVAK